MKLDAAPCGGQRQRPWVNKIPVEQNINDWIDDGESSVIFRFVDGDISLIHIIGRGIESIRNVRVDHLPEPGESGAGADKTPEEFLTSLKQSIEDSILNLECEIEEDTGSWILSFRSLNESTEHQEIPMVYDHQSDITVNEITVLGMTWGYEYAPSWYDWENQPKNAMGTAPLGQETGLIILEEPGIRIPFEGLVSPESVFPASGSIENSISDRLVREVTSNSYAYLEIHEHYKMMNNTRLSFENPEGEAYEFTIGQDPTTLVPAATYPRYDIEIDFESASVSATTIATTIASYINTQRPSALHRWFAEAEQRRIKVTYQDIDSDQCGISIQNMGVDVDTMPAYVSVVTETETVLDSTTEVLD